MKLKIKSSPTFTSRTQHSSPPCTYGRMRQAGAEYWACAAASNREVWREDIPSSILSDQFQHKYGMFCTCSLTTQTAYCVFRVFPTQLGNSQRFNFRHIFASEKVTRHSHCPAFCPDFSTPNSLANIVLSPLLPDIWLPLDPNRKFPFIRDEPHASVLLQRSQTTLVVQRWGCFDN